MHDRRNRCGLALGWWKLELRITAVEGDREEIGEKTPRRVTQIIRRTEERFQLLKFDRSRILQRKAGGPLKLTNDGMKRAVRVIGRALTNQMVLGIADDPLKQCINDS